MWEFDVNGEMYHEKAINFLGELFTNWKVNIYFFRISIMNKLLYRLVIKTWFRKILKTMALSPW